MSSFSVSESAARQINSIMKKEPTGSMLRIGVKAGGCSGFSYTFDIDQKTKDDDIVVERDGATVLIDPNSLQYCDGSMLDFVGDFMSQAFKIVNPKATAECGCGTSFAV